MKFGPLGADQVEEEATKNGPAKVKCPFTVEYGDSGGGADAYEFRMHQALRLKDGLGSRIICSSTMADA